MTTLELKNGVIDKIKQINDEEVLTEVFKLLDPDFEDTEIFQISDNQKVAIETAHKQIMNGAYLTNDQADKEIDEWLISPR